MHSNAKIERYYLFFSQLKCCLVDCQTQMQALNSISITGGKIAILKLSAITRHWLSWKINIDITYRDIYICMYKELIVYHKYFMRLQQKWMEWWSEKREWQFIWKTKQEQVKKCKHNRLMHVHARNWEQKQEE